MILRDKVADVIRRNSDNGTMELTADGMAVAIIYALGGDPKQEIEPGYHPLARMTGDSADSGRLAINDYQHQAAKTRHVTDEAIDKLSPQQAKEMLRLFYSVLGLCGEAGEVANKVKKIVRDDGGTVTPERRSEIVKELGGTLWYQADAATELGMPLSHIAKVNIKILASRKERGTLSGDGDNR